EFNLAADPEAAAAVLGSGLPVTLIPLDVTRRVRASRAYVASLRAAGTPAATVSADLIEAYFTTTTGGASRPLHDPCVMLFALRPDLFDCEDLTLSVDTGGGPDAGALTPGEADALSVTVALDVDADKALALLADMLG
ncbi:MAG: nucleoside hydrolase, partial [Nitratireductor sp.]